MLNDRGWQGGSRALIFSFIELDLIGLFQKLGLSFLVVRGEVEKKVVSAQEEAPYSTETRLNSMQEPAALLSEQRLLIKSQYKKLIKFLPL